MHTDITSHKYFDRILRLLAFVVWITLISQVSAQTLTTLHNFDALLGDGSGDYTNSDGAYPIQPLLVATRDIIYGVTMAGGAYGVEKGIGAAGGGTVFKVHTNGSSFETIYDFNPSGNGIRDYPLFSGLILQGELLYGSTYFGGDTNNGYLKGAIFSIDTNTDLPSLLYEFGTNDLAAPIGRLTLSSDGNIIYGALHGDGDGEIYSLKSDGGSPATGIWAPDVPDITAGVTLSPAGDKLYGVTSLGGDYSYGTVFSVLTNGDSLATLYSFTGDEDGASPKAGLLLAGDTLYGTTAGGGESGSMGTVFACASDGSTFTTLHEFSGMDVEDGIYDGATPQTGMLLLVGNTLYGTTAYGGTNDTGVVFEVNTDGTGYQILHTFGALDISGTNVDGANPMCGLSPLGNAFYGATAYGGFGGAGTLFKLDMAHSLVLTQTLINVQIAYGGTQKTGTEQVGYSSGDQWNVIGTPLYDGDGPPPGEPAFGAYGLIDYAGNITSVGVLAYPVGDVPFATSFGGGGDALFQSCGATSTGADWELQIVNLPPGTYDIYVYSALPGGNDPVTFTLTSGGSGYVTVGSSPNYGEFSSLTKSDYGPITMDISGDFEPVCNGLQIYRH